MEVTLRIRVDIPPTLITDEEYTNFDYALVEEDVIDQACLALHDEVAGLRTTAAWTASL